ncbi:dihydrofolate reductase [Patescibacteria group bacterium]|nr:dihydrofolate reductase [Patescibacteria group bacterium]
MKVELIAAITVDGRIAEATNQVSFEWTSKEDKRFFISKTKEAGVLIMGRKTYETIGKPLPNRLNIVMTRDRSKFEDIEGQLEYTSAAPEEIIRDLESRGFESVVIAGGAQIYSLFTNAGLVTDLFITVEPILLGRGVPLVEGIEPQQLKLISVDKLGDQAVLLHYLVPSS